MHLPNTYHGSSCGALVTQQAIVSTNHIAINAAFSFPQFWWPSVVICYNKVVHIDLLCAI